MLFSTGDISGNLNVITFTFRNRSTPRDFWLACLQRNCRQIRWHQTLVWSQECTESFDRCALWHRLGHWFGRVSRLWRARSDDAPRRAFAAWVKSDSAKPYTQALPIASGQDQLCGLGSIVLKMLWYSPSEQMRASAFQASAGLEFSRAIK